MHPVQRIRVSLRPKAKQKVASKHCRHTINAISLWSISELCRHLCVLYGCNPAADICLEEWRCESLLLSQPCPAFLGKNCGKQNSDQSPSVTVCSYWPAICGHHTEALPGVRSRLPPKRTALSVRATSFRPHGLASLFAYDLRHQLCP